MPLAGKEGAPGDGKAAAMTSDGFARPDGAWRPAGRAGGCLTAPAPNAPFAARTPLLRACHRQYICCPPLMLIVEPDTKPASSLHRKATPRAISLAWPRRPHGILAPIFSSTGAGRSEEHKSELQ